VEGKSFRAEAFPAFTPRAMTALAAGLYIVSTPIGNLGDLTFRARDTLAAVDLILAEDTRVAAKLLSHYDISKKVQRYDDHTGESQRPQILAALAEGRRIALISDAGTPLISDPGYKLVRDAAACGANVVPIPGASALLAALAIAGLPTDRFLFAGFPPPKGGPRRAMFETLAGVRSTLVFYETGPRLADSLADMSAVFGAEREAAVARELTKLYETTVRGALGSVDVGEPRGEYVLVVAGAPTATDSPDDDTVRAALREELAGGASRRDAAARVAGRLGLPKRAVYDLAVSLPSTVGPTDE
jgi:16S rRNA (cytidine1402-2'-O)-methyltransferase